MLPQKGHRINKPYSEPLTHRNKLRWMTEGSGIAKEEFHHQCSVIFVMYSDNLTVTVGE